MLIPRINTWRFYFTGLHRMRNWRVRFLCLLLFTFLVKMLLDLHIRYMGRGTLVSQQQTYLSSLEVLWEESPEKEYPPKDGLCWQVAVWMAPPVPRKQYQHGWFIHGYVVSQVEKNIYSIQSIQFNQYKKQTNKKSPYAQFYTHSWSRERQ